MGRACLISAGWRRGAWLGSCAAGMMAVRWLAAKTVALRRPRWRRRPARKVGGVAEDYGGGVRDGAEGIWPLLVPAISGADPWTARREADQAADGGRGQHAAEGAGDDGGLRSERMLAKEGFGEDDVEAARRVHEVAWPWSRRAGARKVTAGIVLWLLL